MSGTISIIVAGGSNSSANGTPDNGALTASDLITDSRSNSGPDGRLKGFIVCIEIWCKEERSRKSDVMHFHDESVRLMKYRMIFSVYLYE